MKIAIIGTRGIPNTYGGFEQFAEYLSISLVKKGHEIVVYSPHFHSYQQRKYKNIEIRHIFSPEKNLGSMANFIYDWLSLRDAIKDNFDIIYETGYQSSAISILRFHKKKGPLIVTNMDGIEWKRSKWSKPVKLLTKLFEKMAIKFSDVLISDNVGIQEYYKNTHKVDSIFIPYGAGIVNQFDNAILSEYNLTPNGYYLLIARLEPENNIETILKGIVTESKKKTIVVGNYSSKYGKYLIEKFKNEKIYFIGGIYNKLTLDNLRHYASAYFHGHSVGGTNPSLLEAMAAQSFIIAHDNNFNRSVLKNNALFFNSSNDIREIIKAIEHKGIEKEIFIKNNLLILKEEYTWSKIVDDYEKLFLKICS